MAKYMRSPDGKITKKPGPILEQKLAADGWIEVPAPEKKRSRAKKSSYYVNHNNAPQY